MRHPHPAGTPSPLRPLRPSAAGRDSFAFDRLAICAPQGDPGALRERHDASRAVGAALLLGAVYAAHTERQRRLARRPAMLRAAGEILLWFGLLVVLPYLVLSIGGAR